VKQNITIYFCNLVSFHVYGAFKELYYQHVPTTLTFRDLAFSILSILIGFHTIPVNSINRMFFVRDAVCYLWGRDCIFRWVPKIMSVLMEQLSCHWTDFQEIWYLWIFQKSVMKIQVSLKLNKTKVYAIWIPIYIFYHISLIFS
jgi:hypothetical protein